MSGKATRGEYLLEVRAEEIPARMLQPAVEQLASDFAARLADRSVSARELETAYTPRRLVLIARGLPESEPDREEQMIGPPVSVAFDADGNPTKAAAGFAKRAGVEVGELDRVTTDKGEYLAAMDRSVGRPLPELLAEVVPEILARLHWAKTMRWGGGVEAGGGNGGSGEGGHGPWVRPVHGVVSVFAGEAVPFNLFGIQAGNETVGHPVLSSEPFVVERAKDYLAKLGERDIEVFASRRAESILAAMEASAEDAGGRLVPDPELLDKLAAICEIPGVIRGELEAQFLELPREVLIASLRDHQSAFTVEAVGEDGEDSGGDSAERVLLPYFLTVMDRPDDPAGRVQAGNEWVVAARLADARFFYGEDKKRSLEERRDDLSRLSFHAKLGSYADKAERIAALTAALVESLAERSGDTGESGVDGEAATLAARLLKVDLTTEMVKEFTSLQGIVGGLYAREEGAPEAVWQAVYDQYLPASTDDPIPRGLVGRLVGLADRMDTLVGLFGLGMVPTGSRDPFGLRRAAQGVVRIALDGELPFDLDLLVAKAARLYHDQLGGETDFADAEEIVETLRPFLQDRVRHVLGLQGYAYDEIAAASAVGVSNLPDLAARVDALHRVRDREDFLSVVRAAKRIANIITDHEEYPLEEDAFVEDAEKALYRAYGELRGDIDAAAQAGDYAGGLAKIAEFADTLDRFFVEVLVMDEDRRLRRNRIALLQGIHRTLSRVARLPEMVVEKG